MTLALPRDFDARCAALAQRLKRLPDKPEETPRATLAALWQFAAGHSLSCEAALQSALPALDAAAEERLRALIERRVAGEPLAHITGRQRFCGLDLLASGEALIPRRETELLAHAALAALRRMRAAADGGDTAPMLAIDVCTGSGNLALALAHHDPQLTVFAADLSEPAVDLARRNVATLKLQNRVQMRVGDLLEPFNEPRFHNNVDLLVCNPPYISTQKMRGMPQEIVGFEPALAFDGGPLGVRIVQRLIREAPTYLRAGGCLAFEVGLGQGPAVRKRLEGTGRYQNVTTACDAAGEIRVIVGTRV